MATVDYSGVAHAASYYQLQGTDLTHGCGALLVMRQERAARPGDHRYPSRHPASRGLAVDGCGALLDYRYPSRHPASRGLAVDGCSDGGVA